MKNTRCIFILIAIFLLTDLTIALAQTPVDGYVFEENNRGFLNQVKITVLELPDNIVRQEVFSDESGHFSFSLPAGQYRFSSKKDIFFDKDETVTVGAEKVYVKFEMKRKPGYLLDATIAESRDDEDEIVDAIQGCDIEIYNRTQKKAELVLKRHKDAFFQFTFEQGNHYTIMIRRQGYLAKRIEAYVNVEGCIICVHGVSNLRPGITENLTAANTMGTLLCNIQLDKAKLDKRIALKNIYYDYDKWDIRPDAAKELNNAVNLMKDNPGISVELGSHTDARGRDQYNLDLSQKRAESAVAYIVTEGIEAKRIVAKGYGETQISNRCKNGVECSEEDHQLNRRTELRITGINMDSLEYMRWPSLEEIVREEEFAAGLKALENQQEVKIKSHDEPEMNPKETIPPAKTPVKGKKQLPEANNSVPLPKIEPAGGGAAEMPHDKPASQTDAIVVENTQLFITTQSGEKAVTGTLSVGEEPASGPKRLPAQYTGYNIEISKTDIELPATHTIFKQHGDVYQQKDTEGNFCYYIGSFDNLIKARNYYQTVAVAKYPSARLCKFTNGDKEYAK